MLFPVNEKFHLRAWNNIWNKGNENYWEYLTTAQFLILIEVLLFKIEANKKDKMAGQGSVDKEISQIWHKYTLCIGRIRDASLLILRLFMAKPQFSHPKM